MSTANSASNRDDLLKSHKFFLFNHTVPKNEVDGVAND